MLLLQTVVPTVVASQTRSATAHSNDDGTVASSLNVFSGFPHLSHLRSSTKGTNTSEMTTYLGVYCDGPSCINKLNRKAIEDVLFRCVECPDTDFCASCVLAPQNLHSQSFHGHLVFQQPPGLIEWRSEYGELSDELCEKGKEIGQLVQCISAAQENGGISSRELTNVAELLEDVQFLVGEYLCCRRLLTWVRLSKLLAP